MGVRAVRLCFTSGAMRNHVPDRAGYGSPPTVSSPSPSRMWMMAGRADVYPLRKLLARGEGEDQELDVFLVGKRLAEDASGWDGRSVARSAKRM